MTVDDASGIVTICKRGRTGLYADDHGVTVCNSLSRARRLAWAEIRCFTDGSTGKDQGHYRWVLHIVLRTGQRIPVTCAEGSATPEMLAGVRQVAERHGIPADLAGVPAKKGRPVERGLYEDPGGRAGVRYWDGRQWSPLLPPDVAKRDSARKSSASWTALPTAEGRWTGAVRLARRAAVLSASAAVVSAGLLAGGLLSESGLYRGTQHAQESVGAWLGAYGSAVLFAILACAFWRNRKSFLELDEAAQDTVSGGPVTQTR
jgi:uncharacterized protein DUF2510